MNSCSCAVVITYNIKSSNGLLHSWFWFWLRVQFTTWLRISELQTNMNCVVFLCVFCVFLLSVESVTYKNTLELQKGVCKVSWVYEVGMGAFYFKLEMKTTGWAALALTLEKGAEDMKNYDIALGGVKPATNSSNMTTTYLYVSLYLVR